MAIIYVTDGVWGTGTGSPLTAAEVDTNFWDLDFRVTEMEENPPSAVGISNIEVIGSQMMIFLSDGTTFGPYTLPVAAFEWRGEAQDGQPVFELDIITVFGEGLFMVLQDHTIDLPFNPDLIILGEPAYLRLWGDDPYRYDVACFVPGAPGLGLDPDEDRLFSHLFATQVFLEDNLANSLFQLRVGPASSLEFEIRKNDTPIGTLNWGAGDTDPAIDFPDAVQFEPGDRLSIMPPVAIDGSAVEFTGTFAGRRGLIPGS
ncbi:MAG: hypothetical protein EHM78_02080 [Myxococcaceae bacterium]|nr:MAG: hypothetical protein EHM78_02080 [Myxococcaceae bacterium]